MKFGTKPGEMIGTWSPVPRLVEMLKHAVTDFSFISETGMTRVSQDNYGYNILIQVRFRRVWTYWSVRSEESKPCPSYSLFPV